MGYFPFLATHGWKPLKQFGIYYLVERAKSGTYGFWSITEETTVNGVPCMTLGQHERPRDHSTEWDLTNYIRH